VPTPQLKTFVVVVLAKNRLPIHTIVITRQSELAALFQLRTPMTGQVSVWLSGNGVADTNEVILRRARLVLGWAIYHGVLVKGQWQCSAAGKVTVRVMHRLHGISTYMIDSLLAWWLRWVLGR